MLRKGTTLGDNMGGGSCIGSTSLSGHVFLKSRDYDFNFLSYRTENNDELKLSLLNNNCDCILITFDSKWCSCISKVYFLLLFCGTHSQST